MKPLKISRESWILFAIGTADLLTTIHWIHQGNAQEANPLFHACWEHGVLAFIVAKYVFLLGPLFILEWARQAKPRLGKWALRSAVLAYVGLYGLGVVRLNNTRAEAQTPPLWNSVVIHGKNGKTHILMYALSGEDKLIPSPRVQLEMQWLHDRHGMAARPASTPAAADKPSIVMP